MTSETTAETPDRAAGGLDIKDLAARSGGFALVGAIGFLLEAALLALLVAAGWSAIAARAVSFPAAVTTTWLLNRGWVYADRRAHQPRREAALYLAVQSSGFAANLVVFLAVLRLIGEEGPLAALIALIAGSAAGLVVNFAGSHLFVFPQKAAPSVAAGADDGAERAGAEQ
ncbi:MAG: GtrA family protein [Pseudomonadota bacterium]